jgi:transposase
VKIIDRLKDKDHLSETQEQYLNRLNSTLARIENSFDRPRQPLYQSLPNIVVGVCLGLEVPVTISVFDISTHQTLAHYSVRDLLGKNYSLFLRRRREQQRTSHLRHKAQKREAFNQFGESELGQYVDRLLAKAIVNTAKTYKASSIAVPRLSDMREIVQAEVQAKAEQKCPGYLQGQQKYAKQYRVSVHRWSYARLIESIRTQASKLGILLEEGQQPFQGSTQDKAQNVAIAAYQSRKK